jgi:hypothetical protein
MTKAENMTTKEKITENNIKDKSKNITTGTIGQENMTKVEKMTDHIIEKFGVRTDIFKSGGRWSVMSENRYNMDGIKMKEIREYVTSHSEELEEDDNI